ncbi:hypothetical protein RhiirA4_462869 [Rhizophagus irregularis]|uniref:Uncharacterized protein n=1 Tax=Rhizophagus irregularis TaxID=588596 RepID=A0A2I1GLT6_9GLOM|nr:hypothetical protein RhiirA4_462869 [Rhizophagus irregularis]
MGISSTGIFTDLDPTISILVMALLRPVLVMMALLRLIFAVATDIEKDFGELLAYISNNPDKILDLEESLKCGNDNVKDIYLRSLLTGIGSLIAGIAGIKLQENVNIHSGSDNLEDSELVTGLYNTKDNALEVTVKGNDDEGSPSDEEEEENVSNIELVQVEKTSRIKYQGTTLDIILLTAKTISYKSRLVGELRTKKIFVLYICKCNETSTGYLSTPCIQQIFEAIHNNKFGTLLSLAIKQIKAKNWNEEEFWSIQTKAEHKNECRDFWNSIFKSLEQVELSSDCRIPLWGSFAQSGVSLINLIHLASQKIRNFSKNDKDYLANLACTACTLALEVSPRIAEVDILIASHMETAIGVSLDRTIEAGERENLPIASYFEAYADASLLRNEIESLDKFLKDMQIHDAEISFNHWTSHLCKLSIRLCGIGENKFLSKKLVVEAYHRHTAFKMPFGFYDIDHIIPFKYSAADPQTAFDDELRK